MPLISVRKQQAKQEVWRGHQGGWMISTYEILERFSDGSTLWRATVTGIQNARDTLEKLSTETENECYVMKLETGEIVACTMGKVVLAAHA